MQVIAIAILSVLFQILLAPVLASPLESFAGVATLHGEFTLTHVQDPVFGHPDTDAFNHLVGLPLVFDVSFGSIAFEHRVDDSNNHVKRLEVRTGPVQITLSGDATEYLQQTVAPTFAAAYMELHLSHDVWTQQTTLGMISIIGPVATQFFGLELATTRVDDVLDVPLDENGFPVLADFVVPNTSVILRRYTSPPFDMTDYADGSVSLTFTQAGEVNARSATFGQAKTRYR